MGSNNGDTFQKVSYIPVVKNGNDFFNFNIKIENRKIKNLSNNTYGYCYRTTGDDYPKISVHREAKVVKPYAIRFGPVTRDIPFCTDPDLADNLLLAYCKRISPIMPVAQQDTLLKLRTFVGSYLKKNLTPLPHLSDMQEQFDLWLLSCHYTENRKKQLRTSFATLSQRNFLLHQQDFKVKSFIKREFYSTLKNLRFINSRTDIFKVYLGPYIRLIEDQFFQLPHFIKHHQVLEIPSLIDKLKTFKYFVQTDYTSFESGFNPLYTDSVECQLFRYMFQNNPIILENVLKCYYQTMPNGKIIPRNESVKHVKGNYHFRVVGSRMSGEMWTSLGNSFSNLMNMLFLCHCHNIQVDGIVEGDDGIFGMSSNALTKFDFETLGFSIKLQYLQSLQKAVFCGIHYNPTDLKPLISVQNTIRVGWTHHSQYFNSGPQVLNELLLAKAMSLYCIGQFTPIAGVLAFKIIQQLRKNNPDIQPHKRYLEDWWFSTVYQPLIEKQHYFGPVTITDDARQFYSEQYNIDPLTQLQIEELILNCKDITTLVIPYNLSRQCNLSNLMLL